MLKAQDIRLRLQQMLSEAWTPPKEDVPVYLLATEWIAFAEHYGAAAELLSQRAEPVSYLPRILLCGHAVECALKACLVAKSQPVPHSHDLVTLADRVQELEFVLQEPDLVAIVHLNSVYSEDLVTLTRFRVRYPTKHFEANAQIYAPQNAVTRIVGSLTSQATRFNEYTNRKFWSGVDGDA